MGSELNEINFRDGFIHEKFKQFVSLLSSSRKSQINSKNLNKQKNVT